MSADKVKGEMISFEVRIIFRNTRRIDLTEMAEAAKQNMFDMLSIMMSSIQVKKYGLLMTGKGPIAEILRIGENSYQLTNEGGLEIIVNIGDDQTFYMKEGRIHDLRDEESRATLVLPAFDDAEPDEEEFDRIGL